MGKLKDFIEKVKRMKHIELIAVAALAAVVLAIYFACVSCSPKTTVDTSLDLDGSDYCTSMRARLEKVVSEISGVGNASIVINWDKSVVSTFGSGTAENPQATGAIIVCDGGNDPKVKVDVIFAVSTLLNLSIDKIMVYPKSNL